MTYNLKIIPNEQTPVVPVIDNIQLFLHENAEKLQAFLNFVGNDISCSTAVGLAANQVSINDERFNVNVFAIKKISTDNSFRLIINPIINNYIGIKELKTEGCLTWVNKTIVAERSRAINVTYYDINGVKYDNEIYKGFVAQIFQHEVNHLLGIYEIIKEISFKIKPLNIMRNEMCPCKSGKKYKNCCLNLI